ncbi:MAG: hypothetical protein ACRED5_13615 [Propylenella sp.]
MTVDPFWKTFAQGLGFEWREGIEIQGASGIVHEFTAIGVDDRNKRLLLVSQSLDPRLAALVHSDIAQTLSDTRLVTARPILFDLQQAAKLVATVIGSDAFSVEQFNEAASRFNAPSTATPLHEDSQTEGGRPGLLEIAEQMGVSSLITPFIRAAAHTQPDVAEQAIHFVRQLCQMDWKGVFAEAESKHLISLEPLVRADTQKWDREYGLCPVPLYEFSEHDWERFRSGRSIDDARNRLKELGIEQYFNVPPDNTALGLVDHGLTSPEGIQRTIESLPSLGHPLADPEITGARLVDTIQVLAERGFIVEGEIGVEITEKGEEIRGAVKFRPREGIFAKILRANVKLSLGDGWFSQHYKL